MAEQTPPPPPTVPPPPPAAAVPPPAAPPSSAQGPQAPPSLTPPYASIGDRLLAQAIDLLLVAAVFYFVGLWIAPRFGGLTSGGYGFQLEGWPALLTITFTVLPALIYFVIGEGWLGATLGKVIAGIRVQRVAGGKIGFMSALWRTLLRLVDGAAFYVVGAILVIVTKHHQRLGDFAAGSVVVRRETAAWAKILALIGVLLLLGGGIGGAVMIRRSAATSGPGARPVELPAATATPGAGTGPGAGAAPPASPAGGPYPVPDMTGFTQTRSFKFDAVFLVQGDETTVDEFANAAGDKILRFTTGTVVWAYGWVPKEGGTDAGYVIRDPSCSGAFTEKLASNVRLIAPDCAAATIKGP